MAKILHQLIGSLYPINCRVSYIPGGCLGFLNHQQYYYFYSYYTSTTTPATTGNSALVQSRGLTIRGKGETIEMLFQVSIP